MEFDNSRLEFEKRLNMLDRDTSKQITISAHKKALKLDSDEKYLNAPKLS